MPSITSSTPDEFLCGRQGSVTNNATSCLSSARTSCSSRIQPRETNPFLLFPPPVWQPYICSCQVLLCCLQSSAIYICLHIHTFLFITLAFPQFLLFFQMMLMERRNYLLQMWCWTAVPVIFFFFFNLRIGKSI